MLKSGSKKEIIHNEENSAGSLYVENKGTIKGDVNLVGSNLILGDNSIINGKLTTDSNELHSSYSLEEKKKGFSSSIGSGGFSVGYGKSQSKLKEKDLTNAKSNLVLGDNVTLNKGAEITATNFTHGKVTVNNGDVKFGARKDTRDVETSSKSSGVNLSVRIKSEALDRAKQGVDSVNQIKSGDTLGGLASATNTVTGIVSGLASNQGTKLPTSAVNKNNSNDDDDDDDKNNQTNTVGKDNLKAAQANNNFYANIGVNLGFNKSSSKSNSHSESAVVTTIRGKDENSSITYNNVKNVEYVGTQAQDTKFIYNNVENINKTAVELNNSYSSTGKSSGISTGVTIGYGDGTQTEFNGVSISASKSNMNSNGTTYQNGRFVNVDEVHNNTKNMTLSGFNQEGGTVTGNIENLTIESKQNTSTTKGSTKGVSLSVSANGLPSGSANYSKTNGERRVVDNTSTFIIGDGSDLKVAKVENTASAIGTTENGKLSINEYVGHNLENVDKLKTAGGSVGVSTSGITSIGVNYSDRKQEGITKNTVIGNVEIGKSSGDEINRDLDTMTEITEDRDFKTNINVESQTINYIKNPEKFKEDLQKAKNEIYDIYHAVDSTVNLQGKEDRNISEQLGEVRQAKVIYNLIDSRLQEAKNQEDIAKAFEEASEDLGYKVKVIFTDPSNSPQLIGVDKKGNTYIKNGTAYVDKKTGIGYILVNTESAANSTKAGVIGTIAEEQSHIIGKKEGRQKVVPDGSEKGLESLGKPTNDYFKKQYSKNDKVIGIKSDGKDYSNVDFGENVGDASNPEDLKFKEYYRKDILSKDPNYKKIKFLVSMGTNMIPGVGEVKLGIEMFVGEDLLTEEKYDLIDRVQIGTSISKNISSRGINRLENQLSNSKNSQKFQLIKTELDTRNQQGQNGQQHQKGQNSVVQNNKNSINKTQPQGNQDYSGNQQVSKGATSNNQQGAPVSKTSDINKSGVSQVAAPPSYLTKPEQGGTLVIGAGNKPIKGAYNVDIKENIKIGVFKGDATNLVNVPTGSQAKVIIENPNGFDPLNPEILRVVKEGGEIEITGIKSNKEFFKIYSGEVEVPKGFEIIEVGEIPENFQKQGFRTNGDLIGQKNGVGTPKKTDKIIRIRKIKK